VHSIGKERFSAALRLLRLRTAFAWFEFAPGQPLDASKNAITSERPSNALRGVQPVEQIRFGLAGQQIGETRKPVLDGGQRGQRPSSVPRRCARVLDHRQFCAVQPTAPAPG